MDYAEVNNGKITEIISTSEEVILSDSQKEIDGDSFEGHVGMDAQMIDWETGKILPEDRLIEAGILADNRGEYWHKKTRERREITEAGEAAPAGHTKVKPPDDAFARWKEDEGGWVVDEKAKEDDRLLTLRLRRRGEFQVFDKYQMPVLAGSLNAKQKSEYTAWRQGWLDAPATGEIPERPNWFKEY